MGMFAVGDVNGFTSIRGFEDFEITLRLENASDETTCLGCVVNHKYSRETVRRHIVESRQQSLLWRYCFRFFCTQVHITRPVLTEQELFRRKSMPGTVHHHSICGFDNSSAHELE